MSKQDNRIFHGLQALPPEDTGFLLPIDGNILGYVLGLITRTKDNAKNSSFMQCN
jgi:hypothetical protein